MIDLKNNSVLPLPIQTGDGPGCIAFTPNGKDAYVTNFLDNTVVEINTKTGEIVGDPIPVKIGPSWVVVTPDGKKAYVINQYTGISVIDTKTNKVTTTIPISSNNTGYALGCALTPDGKYLYAPSQDQNTVVMVSTQTDEIVGEPISLGTSAGMIAFAPNGQHAYITDIYSYDVAVISITGD